MIELQLSIDTKAIDRFALLTEKNLRYAASNALRETVLIAKDALRTDLEKKSGGPIVGGATAWTKGGTYAKRPSASNLVAEVGLRSDQSRAAGRYISVLTKGGEPKDKGADLFISAVVGRAVTMVPTRKQRLDAKGNVSRAAFNKALKGWAQMTGSRKLVNRANRMFIVPIKGPAGRMGIFERTSKPGRGQYGKWEGTTLKFTLEPNPKPRASTYDLTGNLQRSTGKVWPGLIKDQLEAELRRAGFTRR
jgi:hypothetical protein